VKRLGQLQGSSGEIEPAVEVAGEHQAAGHQSLRGAKRGVHGVDVAEVDLSLVHHSGLGDELGPTLVEVDLHSSTHALQRDADAEKATT
jgi:hypothetical protein